MTSRVVYLIFRHMHYKTITVNFNEFLLQNPTLKVIDGYEFHGLEIYRHYSRTGSIFDQQIKFLNCKFTGRVSVINFRSIEFENCMIEDLLVDSNFGNLNLPCGINIYSSLPNSSMRKLELSGLCDVKVVDYNISFLIFNSDKEIFEGLKLFNSKVDKFSVTSLNLSKMASVQTNPKINVDSISFDNCHFNEIPGFNLVDFGQQIEFLDCGFSDISANTHSTFRHLKSISMKVNNEFLSNLFASYELKSKFDSLQVRKSQNKKVDKVDYLLNVLFEQLSDFGLV